MESDLLVRIVNIVAPRSRRNAVAKGFILFALIVATSIPAKAVLLRSEIDWVRELCATTVIALPFVILTMVVLIHQYNLQQMLSAMATTDTLTGLPNRRDFMARAQASLEREGAGALLLLDADHFKRINDGWGHGAGDAALIAIGHHLRAALRPGDILGRLGGEEFAAFLPSISAKDTHRLGERLCAPIPVEADEIHGVLSVTLSVGAALAQEGCSLDALMAQADGALYRAKADGRARMNVAGEEERDRAA